MAKEITLQDDTEWLAASTIAWLAASGEYPATLKYCEHALKLLQAHRLQCEGK